MNDALFERDFAIGDVGSIHVEIFEPQEIDHFWVCKHAICWPDGTRIYDTTGADKLQSFVLCLSRVEAQLLAEQNRLNKTISWLGESELGIIWADWQKAG